jgi:hypothetical protein
MNARRIGLVLACFWVILMASTAMAGSMHPHARHAVVTDGAPLHPHAPQAVSPFEVKLGDKRLHCELLGHNPLIPCPHHKIPAGGKDKGSLTSDCGGGPFQGPGFRSVGDSPRFLIPVVTAEDVARDSTNISNNSVFYDPFYSHSLDRPPRAL